MRRVLVLALVLVFMLNFTGCTKGTNSTTSNKIQVEKKITPDQAKEKLEKDYGVQFNANNFILMIRTHETEKVKLFLQGGIDPNTRCMDNNDKAYYGKTALMMATMMGYEDIVYMLVEDYKADVNALDNSQCNVLWRVSDSPKEDKATLVKYFVEKGAKVNYVEPTNDNDALTYAILKSQKEVVKALVENGADIKRNNTEQKIPILSVAVMVKSNEDMLKNLIQLGADVNAKDKDGYTPLQIALLWNSNFEVIKVLVENGADVNAKHGDLTVLKNAKYSSSPNQQIIDFLIAHGAK